MRSLDRCSYASTISIAVLSPSVWRDSCAASWRMVSCPRKGRGAQGAWLPSSLSGHSNPGGEGCYGRRVAAGGTCMSSAARWLRSRASACREADRHCSIAALAAATCCSSRPVR